MLLIDTREKGNLHKKVAAEFPHEYRALGAGDFWIPKEDGFIILERSSYADFVGKIMSGRVWEQLEKCKSKSDDFYFILENPTLLKYTKMNYKAVISCIVSLTRQGAKVVTTRNASETHQVIKYLYEKYNTDKKVTHSETRVKPKSMTSKEQAVYALMGISKIGKKTAESILENRSLFELAEYLQTHDKDNSDYDKSLHSKLCDVFNAK